MNTIRRCHSLQSNYKPTLHIEASVNGKFERVEIPQYAIKFVFFII